MQQSTEATPSRPRYLVTTPEAATYAGVSEKTVRNWIDQGRLTRYRLGVKLVRVDLDEVDALAQPERVAR